MAEFALILMVLVPFCATIAVLLFALKTARTRREEGTVVHRNFAVVSAFIVVGSLFGLVTNAWHFYGSLGNANPDGSLHIAIGFADHHAFPTGQELATAVRLKLPREFIVSATNNREALIFGAAQPAEGTKGSTVRTDVILNGQHVAQRSELFLHWFIRDFGSFVAGLMMFLASVRLPRSSIFDRASGPLLLAASPVGFAASLLASNLDLRTMTELAENLDIGRYGLSADTPAALTMNMYWVLLGVFAVLGVLSARPLVEASTC